MTAEIAILNSSGIALAADSAVTIGNQKVYNSANKLFTLSKYDPVGIMVYDSADFIGVPWELIIKEYRAYLGKTSFNTLSEYADNFWSFLNNNEDLIPQDRKLQYVYSQCFTHLSLISSKLESKIQARIVESNETNLEESVIFLLEILSEHEALISTAKILPEFANFDINQIFLTWQDEIVESIASQLGILYSELLSDEDKNRLHLLICKLFINNRFLLPVTGVVFAGFGKKDYFPKIASYKVEGIFGSIVKKEFLEGKSNTQNTNFSTTIIPFAQDEMVWTFIGGIDPEVQTFANTFLADVFKHYPSSLNNDELGLSLEAVEIISNKITQDATEILEKFKDELLKYRQKNNIQPIIDMVAVLPKDELAAMAESLVNLTVFKRKVSNSVETVGGPIDVAVISKGDGFIWVKRKHYFKPELNQHFLSNYFKERG